METVVASMVIEGRVRTMSTCLIGQWVPVSILGRLGLEFGSGSFPIHELQITECIPLLIMLAQQRYARYWPSKMCKTRVGVD